MDTNLSYCQACLSQDRKLYSLSECMTLFQAVSFWELSGCRGGMCWECHYKLVKFSKFKLQVRKAQTQLQNVYKLKELSCLSSLTKATNKIKEYLINYDKNEEEKEAVTKKLEHTNLEHNLLSFDVEELKIKIENQDVYNSDHGDEKNSEELIGDVNEGEPVTSDEEVLSEVAKRKMRRKIVEKSIRKYSCNEGDFEIEDRKLLTIKLTDEELTRRREEKRTQPNFKKIPYKCNSCVLGFTRKDTYEMHLEKKHDEKIGPLTCKVCSTRFALAKHMSKHMEKHYLIYRCRLCKYESTELWSARVHSRNKHRKDELDKIHCVYCNFVARCPEELSRHTVAEHSVYCNQCGEKFKALSTLKAHIRRSHTIKREFICDLCKRTFKTKSRLESHMVKHNSDIAQTLAYCAVCKIQYKNIYVYRNHLRTSANHAEQTYECVDCNKRFASKVYWKKHFNFYHLHKSQYYCDICKKLFISEWKLKCHKQTQHGMSRSRTHHCSQCGKQFYTLSTLKGHQLTHSQRRTYMCSYCGDTFRQRPALYNHCKLLHKPKEKVETTNL